MTVELARRLIETGVPLADIEGALLLMVERGLPLSEALAERDPGLLVVFDQELARADLPSVLTVRPSPELCGRLPAGLCARLLAVPVHTDPRSGRVDVAAVEPLDQHVAQEFSFHLNAPVRVLLAPRDSVKAALDKLKQGDNFSPKSPPPKLASGFGSEAPIPLVTKEVARKPDSSFRSDAPIPLVRRSLMPGAATRRSAPPGGRGSVRPAAAELSVEPAEVRMSWRSKPPPSDLLQRDPHGEIEPGPLPPRSVTPPPPAPPALSVRELLEQAQTPDQVVALLREALRPALTIIFTIKSASFDGRAASAAIEERTQVKQISLLSHQPSVLETAVKSGFYLGPVPNTPNHRELREALPADAVNEVYVTVITVSERASLVWLVAGFEQSLDLTRRADELALAAGRALGRILRSRKRGG